MAPVVGLGPLRESFNAHARDELWRPEIFDAVREARCCIATGDTATTITTGTERWAG